MSDAEAKRRACASCLLAKVRCVREHPDTKCQRCTRLNRDCVPAPPSRQGKRLRPSKNEGARKNALVSRLGLPERVKLNFLPYAHNEDILNVLRTHCMPQDFDSVMIHGFFSQSSVVTPQSLLFFVKMLAGICFQRRLHEKFDLIKRISGACGLDVSQVWERPRSNYVAAGSPTSHYRCS